MTTRTYPHRSPRIGSPWQEYALLAAITLLAAGLRFFHLGNWSFWGDEIFSIGDKPDGFIQSTTTFLIHWATGVFGMSEWSARLLPALIGTLTIPLLYIPIRQQFGVLSSLLAAALLAVSPWHIYWSQNARFYVLLLLFYTLAFLTFYLGLERDRPWYFVAALIFFGLAAKERMLALMFLPVCLSFLLCLQFLPFEKPKGYRLRNLAIFFFPLMLLGMIFAWPFLRDIPGWMHGFSRVNNTPLWLLAGTVYYIGLPVVLFALSGAVYFLRDRDRAVLYLTLGALVPIVMIVLASPFQYTANRYAFISLTSWILLAAVAAGELVSRLAHSNLRIFAMGVVSILILTSLSEVFLYFNFQNGNRENWRSAFEYIRQNWKEGDLVVLDQRDIADYYLQKEATSYRRLDPGQLPDARRIWFIEDMNVAELFPDDLVWVRQNAPQVADFDVHVNARLFKMRLYLYETSAPPSP